MLSISHHFRKTAIPQRRPSAPPWFRETPSFALKSSPPIKPPFRRSTTMFPHHSPIYEVKLPFGPPSSIERWTSAFTTLWWPLGKKSAQATTNLSSAFLDVHPNKPRLFRSTSTKFKPTSISFSLPTKYLFKRRKA